MTDPKRIEPPWNAVTVDALNRFQRSGTFHPFTCPSDHHDGGPDLIAGANGWYCPDSDCTYRQRWAHRFMAEMFATGDLR